MLERGRGKMECKLKIENRKLPTVVCNDSKPQTAAKDGLQLSATKRNRFRPARLISTQMLVNYIVVINAVNLVLHLHFLAPVRRPSPLGLRAHARRGRVSVRRVRTAPITNCSLSIIHCPNARQRQFFWGVACCTLFQVLSPPGVLKTENATPAMLLRAGDTAV